MIDNFDQLVARCERARQRRIIRLSFMIVGTILFVIAGVSGYQMWFTSQTSSTPAKMASIIPETTIPPPSVPAADQQLKQTSASDTVQKAVVTTPLTQTKKEQTVTPAPSVPVAAVKPESIVPTAPAVVQSVPTSVPTAKNDRLFEVNTQKADTPLEAYQNSPKYETALEVARDYYAKKDYANAATWAKKANQLNREAEDAWLLYAKSYYAQGKKTEAIGVLELYLNYKDSKAASELLRTWKLNNPN
ncbi:CDC27 family protein [Sulfuricurvum sp.]|uniref:CDC27 family protein n=1 Tax=Sulfuricurvum sp. TaxID=2025608 RepID=UPI002D31B059|nr:CDC27 family protein [Sulfuricurvum sp.]HZF69354.1 CDC27 family protein [Sulfuricurvum sp.]